MTDDCITLIWLDLTYTVCSRNESVQTHVALCKVDPYLITFRDAEKCLDYIAELTEEKVILIVTHETSVFSADSIVSQRNYDVQQINALYIIYSTETNTSDFMMMASKIHRVSRAQLQPFCDQLSSIPSFQQRRQRPRATFIRNDFTVTPLLSPPSPLPTDSPITTDYSVVSQLNDTVKQQEADFMYGQLFRNILIVQESTIEEMIEYCRQKYANNQSDLNVIDEFKDYYDKCNAIYWYTRDTFLYRLLNKALRDRDVDTLYSIRYFMKDLHERIVGEYGQQYLMAIAFNNVGNSILAIETVYRGQLIANEEFDQKIRYNTGGFFLVSSFFSTTTKKDLACIFAGDGNRNDEASVLFQIDIDHHVKEFDYADITRESAFGDTEIEVLFSMGAVFRILSVDRIKARFWNVHLKLTVEKNEEFRALMERLKEPAFDNHPLYSWANLMFAMGKYKQAELIYLRALADQTVIRQFELLPAIYKQLGSVYNEIGQHNKAIEYFEQSLEIRLKQHPPTHLFVVSLYSNLGSAYQNYNDLEKALIYYNKALAMELNRVKPDNRELAVLYNSISSVCKRQQNYSGAFEMCEKAIKTQVRVLSAHHQSLTTSIGIFSQGKSFQCDYNKALEYLYNIFQIQVSSFGPIHPTTATGQDRLAAALSYHEKFKKCLDIMKTSYEMQQENVFS